ncbi:sensor histidine kinase [Lapillicoccus jejuensis]|uniref:histidine kinase n=1 Tax=Lapillicoccus jejuensis TaxID=402171 RepID=A0A542E2L9_9MICO|nr:PAS domain-containing sensor histidine kinase [Lapillicoccus jejuensis]TQJ09587.1 two-component sensor histidine kinase [Lapillicoccus jejuensis]
MATLAELLNEHSDLEVADVEWLHLLVGDWQLLSDLSFADLVLWVRSSRVQWNAVAHVRPTTGQMVFYEDQVGGRASRGRSETLEQAFSERRIVRERDTEWRDDLPVREEAIPVVRRGRAIAVISRHTNLSMMRTPSRLELTYLATADALSRMIAGGEFPHAAAPTGLRRGAPRVGDGVVRLDADGTTTYASPNAISAIHRLGYVGDVVGESLSGIVTSVLRDSSPVDEGLPFVLTGRQPWRTEVVGRGATVSMRAIPLTEVGQRFGALLLVRDVSELRRREQELLTKDATIREIHHRVKNNLQSVAALLRLQARRTDDPVGREALHEAERRVGTIALVHETLSQGFDETVDFDDVADRAFRAVVEVASYDQKIARERTGGRFGRLKAEDATSLAMILSELVQNAVEHGLAGTGGTVSVDVSRTSSGDGELLRVRIADDGAGIPPDRRPGSGLGTQIVQSLVQDLRGSIAWRAGEPRGTVVEFSAQLRTLPADGRS